MATMNQVGVGLSGASGTGNFAGTTSPTFVTPDIGAATGTSLSVSGNLTAQGGYILAGQSSGGGSGGGFQAYATTASSGFFQVYSTANGSGNFGTSITNSSTVAQNQVLTIPDCGAGSANILLTRTASGAQAATGTLGANGVISGTSAGVANNYFLSFSPTTASGNLLMQATNSSGNYQGIITNASLSAARTWTLPDATGTIALTSGGSSFSVGNLSLSGNTISSTNTNGDINFTPNGTGHVKANGGNAAFEFDLISASATGYPALTLYRNTSTVTGRFQGGVNDAFNDTGDGLFVYNQISGGKIFLRDSTGNALTISAGNTTLSGSLTTSQTAGIIGTTTNNNAAAGSIGELLSNSSASGSVSLTTLTPVNITSISLTAGDWDVWGNIEISGAATTVITATRCSLGTVTASFAGYPYDSWNYWPGAATPFASYSVTVAPPAQRFSLSSTTTIYLTMTQVFSVDTMSAGGAIFARRRR